MGFITNITAGVPTTGVYVEGYPEDVDNDQGNIRAGGTISESNKWSVNNLGEGNPIDTISSGVNNQAINAAGTFNNQPSQDIMKVTTSLAGISNSALLYGASDSSNGPSINQLAVMRISAYKQAIVANKWNEYSGAWDSSFPVNAVSGAWNISSSVDNAASMSASGTDVAGNPSSDVPGKLTFLDGSPNPTNQGYAKKTNW